MKALQQFWDENILTIPINKDSSRYAIECEKRFKPKSVICDIGGGIGADARYFLSKGHTVDNYDISSKALDVFSKVAIDSGYAGMFNAYQIDLNSCILTAQDGFYDVVYARLSLHYFKPEMLAKIFDEVYRVLAGNGSAFISLKSASENLENNIKIGNGVYFDEGHIKTRFTQNQLKQILKQTIINQERYHVNSYLEDLSGRNDKLKSNKKILSLNQIRLLPSKN